MHEHCCFATNNRPRRNNPNRELSVDLLITFLHLDAEGSLIIKGADGTPGADWCVTIATSDSDGGEFIITEHRRDSDQPSHDDNPEFQDTKSEAVEVIHAQDISKEHGSNRGEGRVGGEGQGIEKLEHVKDEARQQAEQERSGQRAQRLTSLPEASEEKGLGVEQDHGAGIIKHASSPQEEDRLNSECSNSHYNSERPSSGHGASGALREPISTTPAGTKCTPVQPSNGRNTSPSPVTRFARWIVQRAHKGEETHGNTGGKDTGRAPPENEDVCSDHAPGGGKQLSTPRKSMTSARRLSSAGRTGPSSVTGFEAERFVQVSMTCPLPTKLPFHPDQREEEFDAPMFGTTVLGNSHGFDPKG